MPKIASGMAGSPPSEGGGSLLRRRPNPVGTLSEEEAAEQVAEAEEDQDHAATTAATRAIIESSSEPASLSMPCVNPRTERHEQRGARGSEHVVRAGDEQDAAGGSRGQRRGPARSAAPKSGSASAGSPAASQSRGELGRRRRGRSGPALALRAPRRRARCRRRGRAPAPGPRRSPPASLSARTARQATTGRPPATSGSASASAAAPSGLWAASRKTGGSLGDPLEPAGDSALAATSRDALRVELRRGRPRRRRRRGRSCGAGRRPGRAARTPSPGSSGSARSARAPRSRGGPLRQRRDLGRDPAERPGSCWSRSTASFSAAISSSVSPSHSVWSRPTEVSTVTREGIVLVASSRPPRPGLDHRRPRPGRRRGRRRRPRSPTSNWVTASPSSSVRLTASAASRGALDRGGERRRRRSPRRRSAIRSRPARRRAARRRRRRATPCASSSAAVIRVTEDLPLVPTTWIEAKRCWGMPSSRASACASARGRASSRSARASRGRPRGRSSATARRAPRARRGSARACRAPPRPPRPAPWRRSPRCRACARRARPRRAAPRAASRAARATASASSSVGGEDLDRADRGDRLAAVAVELEAGEAADELLRLDPVDAGRQRRSPTGTSTRSRQARRRRVSSIPPSTSASAAGVEQRLVGHRERVHGEVARAGRVVATRSPR